MLLAEDAVLIFDAQRQREEDEVRWTAERKRWLALSSTLGADPARRTRLAAAPITADVAADSRALYMASAEASIKVARADKRWKVVSRIRRAQAANLYEVAGRPLPAPDDVVALHRDALLAELRGHLTTSKVAELASSGCCAACRKDDGQTFKIADELRTPRLPHAECPKGLCGCDWWLAKAIPAKRRRRRKVATPEA